MKTVRVNFDYMHCDDLARYLERMAREGWHFKKWNMGLVFEKGEPETSVYAVEVFTKASENDMRPEPHTEEFAEYCKAAGWELIDAKRKLCIFKRIKEDAIALFTPEERVENAYKGSCSGYDMVLLLIYGINVLLQWSDLLSFRDGRIFGQSTIWAIVIWSALFLMQSASFLYVYYKKKQLLGEIQKGKEIYIGNRRNGRIQYGKRVLCLLLAGVVIMSFLMGQQMEISAKILCVVILFTSLLFSVFLEKKRPESSVTLLISFIFSFAIVTMLIVWSVGMLSEEDVPENLPLQVSDYRAYTSEIEDVDISEEKNLFGSAVECYIISDDSVYYEVYRSKYTWILDKIWKSNIDENETKTDCAKDWGALEGYRTLIGTYYIRYENAIFILAENSDISLSKEQIAIIREKMDLR